MPRALERVFILYQGAELEVSEVEAIMRSIAEDADLDLAGVRVSTLESRYSEPDVGTAMALMARFERDGGLAPGAVARMITHDLTVNGKRRIVVLIPADTVGDSSKDNPLVEESHVRELIPKHMARVDDSGDSIAWQPGWATLGSEAAVSFAATAHNGDMRRFDDVHVVVSHMTETDPARIRQLMSGSYITFADTIKGFAQLLNQAEVDVAHWIICADANTHAVHLGYFAVTTGSILMPSDLLPPGEPLDAVLREPEALQAGVSDADAEARAERDLALGTPDLPLVQAMVRARRGDPDASDAVHAAILVDRRQWGAPTAPYAAALEALLIGTSTQAMMDNDLTAAQAATLFAIVDALTNASS